jgi:hypothetical protein
MQPPPVFLPLSCLEQDPTEPWCNTDEPDVTLLTSPEKFGCPLSPWSLSAFAEAGETLATIITAKTAATVSTIMIRLTAALPATLIVSCCPIVFLLFG